ncbi:thiamine pyrophosphate-binding protein [Bordetella bronchiseptica]|uniref:thiamine pyrophosphate-binding protein n=1 Tax=Bordetella bronchiseptica TaxID=518 RepID=UPI003F7489C9|nr:acetolactate synthase [Bordetella bronchiseptica]
MSSPITGGRAIAEILQAHGVEHVFFMDAILRRALVEMEHLGIRRILAHSEIAAAYMADGYARVTGRPAVCMAQSVGAANLAAGLQDACLAQTAIVALTGRQPAAMQYRNAYQELAHEPLFRSTTKNSMRVDQVEQVPHVLRQAFREATTGRPGPVHVDIAGHTGDAIGSAILDGYEPAGRPFAAAPAFRQPAEGRLVEEAAGLIAHAQRPVIVADMGVCTSAAQQALRRFAEHAAIPVVMSLDAKAVLPEMHPLNGGVAGTYSRACANRIVAAADLVIFAGSIVGDHISHNWMLPRPGTPVIQMDIDPAQLGRNYPGTLGLPGDARTVLEQLVQACRPGERAEWLALMAGFVREWRDSVAQERASDAVPIRPERLCAALSDVLPPDAILVADTGYSSQWTGTYVDLRHEGQHYLRAAGSLGWGFPASLGAKLAAPRRPVVCFTGDGGFMYHMAELETALRWGLNTITVVNNNHCLAQGTRSIMAAYEGSDGRRDEIYCYRPMDFAAIAQAMGCTGIRVTRPEDFEAAFGQALASDRPVVIDVVSDPGALAPLPWVP